MPFSLRRRSAASPPPDPSPDRFLDACRSLDAAGTPPSSLDASPPLVLYCVRRLLKGLSSSNRGARQGFALALTGCLSLLSLSLPAALAAVDEALPLPGSTAKRSEARDVWLGRLFAIGALARAGLVPDDDADAASEIIDNLLRVGSFSAFLREAATSAVLDVLERLPAPTATKTITKCQRLITFLTSSGTTTKDHSTTAEATTASTSSPTPTSTPGTTAGTSPDALFLAIRLWDVLPSDVARACHHLPDLPAGTRRPGADFFRHPDPRQALEVATATAAFFAPSHLEKLTVPLKAACIVAPRVHSCWLAILALLIPGFRVSAASSSFHDHHNGQHAPSTSKRTNGSANTSQSDSKDNKDSAGSKGTPSATHVSALWRVVVDGALLASASHDRHLLAFHLCQLLLGTADATLIGILLCPRLLTVVATHASRRDATLNAAAHHLINRLRSAAGRSDTVRMAVVARLRSHGVRGFDAAAGTSLGDELVAGVGGEALGTYVQQLQDAWIADAEIAARARVGGDANETKFPVDGAGEGEEDTEAHAALTTARARQRLTLDQLVQVLAMKAIPSAVREEALVFLTLHAFVSDSDPETKTEKRKKSSSGHPRKSSKNKGEGLGTGAQSVVERLLPGISHAALDAPTRRLCAAKVIQLVAGGTGADDPHEGETTTAAAKKGAKKGASAAEDWRREREEKKARQDAALQLVLSTVTFATTTADTGYVLAAERGDRESNPHTTMDVDTDAGVTVTEALAALRTAHATLVGVTSQKATALSFAVDLLQLYVMAVPDMLDLSVAQDLAIVAETIANEHQETPTSSTKPEEEEQQKGAKKKGQQKKDKVMFGEERAEVPTGTGYADVLMDVSLSVLSRSLDTVSTVPLRHAFETLSASCANEVGVRGLMRLVEVIEQPLGEDDDDQGDFDMDDESMEGVEGGDEDDNPKDKEEDGDDGDDDELDGNPEKDEALERLGDALDEIQRRRQRRADGHGGGSDDDEPSEISDLDDEAMFKTDKALGAMMRAAKDKKQAAQQARLGQIALKFRAITLVDTVLQHFPASPHVPALIPRLLKGLRAAAMPSGDAALAQRLQVLLTGRVARSKLASGSHLTPEEGQGLLRTCLRAAARAPSGAVLEVVAPAAERCAAYALRILTTKPAPIPQQQPIVNREGIEAATAVLDESLRSFFHARRSRLRRAFLDQIFREWAPDVGVALLPRLVGDAAEARSDVKRTEALELVLDVLSRNPKQYAESIGKNLTKEKDQEKEKGTLAKMTTLDVLVQAVEASVGAGFVGNRAQVQALAAAVEVVGKVGVFKRNGVSFNATQRRALLAVAERVRNREGVVQRAVDVAKRLRVLCEGGHPDSGKEADNDKDKRRKNRGGEGVKEGPPGAKDKDKGHAPDHKAKVVPMVRPPNAGMRKKPAGGEAGVTGGKRGDEVESVGVSASPKKPKRSAGEEMEDRTAKKAKGNKKEKEKEKKEKKERKEKKEKKTT